MENFIGLAEPVFHRGPLVHHVEKALIPYNDKAVDRLPHFANTLAGDFHSLLTLNLKGLGYHADSQGAAFPRRLGDYGRRPRTGTAAHAGSHEYHVGALYGVDDHVPIFQRRFFAKIGVAARSQPQGEFRPDRKLNIRLAFVKHLLIRIDGDKLHPQKAVLDHVVYGVAPAAAYADNFDNRLLWADNFIFGNPNIHFSPPVLFTNFYNSQSVLF
jgi:hypothetical protein